MDDQVKYWKDRCEAAEEYIAALDTLFPSRARMERALRDWREWKQTEPPKAKAATGRQHKGSIESSRTMEGRIYRLLRDRVGEWVESWEILREIPTRVLSTYVSSIRAQLPAGWTLENRHDTIDGKRRDWYRLAGPSEDSPARPGEGRVACRG